MTNNFLTSKFTFVLINTALILFLLYGVANLITNDDVKITHLLLVSFTALFLSLYNYFGSNKK